MTRRIASIATSLILATVMLGGCATGGGTSTAKGKTAKGPSDQDLVKAGLGQYKAALMEKNVDKLMLLFSENFKDGEGNTKAQLKERISGFISQGYLDGIKVDTDSTAVTVTGTTATTTPVGLTGTMGSISLSLSWAKEGADWKIVNTTMS